MEPFVGQIQPFGFNFPPRGWAQCDGTLLAISQNTALFSLLGTIYGGDGRTTFALPDLRGRAALHMGNGPGLSSRPIGQRTGYETTTLTTLNMPAHNHTVTNPALADEGTADDPTGAFLAIPDSGAKLYATTHDAAMGTFNSGSAGSGQHFNNMQPYLVVNWCIALVGLYPSRN